MLKNSKIAIIGDSISTYEGCVPDGWRVYYTGEIRQITGVKNVEDTWWKLLTDVLDASEVRSYSYSGSMIEGRAFPAACSVKRVTTIIDDGYKPDVFIVFMGINDYGWGGAYNQAKGGSEAKSFSVDCEFSVHECFFAESTALSNFEHAYGQLICNIREFFPDSKIFCCSMLPTYIKGVDKETFAYNLRGVPISDYNKAIESACNSFNDAKFLDLAGFGLAYETSDGTHPTNTGMQQIASLVGCAINSDIPDVGLDFHKYNQECNKICAECEHAYSTTKKWHCVCCKDSLSAKEIVDNYMQEIAQ